MKKGRRIAALAVAASMLTTQQAEASEPLDYGAILYTIRQYEKTLSPEELVRFEFQEFGEHVVQRMLHIVKRESGFNCAADNPRSSAAGLFQTLNIHRARAERLGLLWHDVQGPDCLADVILAKDIYKDSGFRPWS